MSELRAEFRFSKLASAWAWLNCGYDDLLAFALVALTSYVSADTTDDVLRVGAVVMYGVAGIAATRVIWRLRYKYVLRCIYVVEAAGIRLLHVAGEPLVTLEQMAEVEYFPTVPAYRFVSSHQSRPIVLFVERGWNPSSMVHRRNHSTARIIRAALGERLKTRWFPW